MDAYQIAIDSYSGYLEYTYLVLQPLQTMKFKDSRFMTSGKLAYKILQHSISVEHLRHGSQFQLSYHPPGAYVIDFSAIYLIVRASLETYLNLYEVYFEEVDEDEFGYRYATFMLGGLRLAEEIPISRLVSRGQEFLDKAVARQVSIEKYRNQIKSNWFFKNKLNQNQQENSVKGGVRYPIGKFSERVSNAGLDKELFAQFYAYLSSHVHGDSLSAIQAGGELSDDEKYFYVNSAIVAQITILAHLISRFSKKFPDINRIYQSNKEYRFLTNAIAQT